MKKIFILFVSMFALISCNKEQINSITDAPVKNSQEVIEFCTRIDSLNYYYSSMTLLDTRKGYISSHLRSSCADAVGRYIGGKICGWVGGAIGTVFGNPVAVYAGIVSGKHFGGAAGSAVASIGAEWLMDRFVSRSDLNPSLVLEPNYVATIKDSNNLTDGELHNLILVELLNNINKYVLSDGNLNYDLLLDDALIIENKYAPIEDFELYKEYWKPLAVEQTKRIVNQTPLLISAGNEAFLESVYYSLIPELQITKEEFDNANLLSEKVLSTYILLDDVTLVEFSNDVDTAIETSELDSSLKSDLKVSNSVLTSSVIIWREVQ